MTTSDNSSYGTIVAILTNLAPANGDNDIILVMKMVTVIWMMFFRHEIR